MPRRSAYCPGPAPKDVAPMPQEDYAPAIVARFWMKVDGGGNRCWEWTASLRNGYGQFGVRAGHVVPAHRFAYEHLVGPIPDGMVIDHLCRNTRCVNPAHLEPVTNVENVMRGESPMARNARTTHCTHGHELVGANLYVDPKGRRQCRACRRASMLAFKQRNPDYYSAENWRAYRARRKESA